MVSGIDADGDEQLGSEFRVNTIIQRSAIRSRDGVVRWRVCCHLGFIGSGWFKLRVYAQRYDVDGSAVGTEFRVNTTTLGSQNYPSMTGLADGGFVVTWTSDVIINGEYRAEI